MPSFNEPLKNWFGYTRRERRATFILLILSAVIAGMRFIHTGHEIEYEKIAGDFPVAPDTKAEAGNISYIPVSSGVQPKKEYRLIELNSCDSASLERLPGIGPVLSVRIIKYRKLLGGFHSVDQLKEVYGLSEETFSMISARLRADSTLLSKIDINKAGFGEIARLPYFSRYEVNSILKYRQMNGSIGTLSELVANRLIAPEKAERIGPYLKFH